MKRNHGHIEKQIITGGLGMVMAEANNLAVTIAYKSKPLSSAQEAAVRAPKMESFCESNHIASSSDEESINIKYKLSFKAN